MPKPLYTRKEYEAAQQEAADKIAELERKLKEAEERARAAEERAEKAEQSKTEASTRADDAERKAREAAGRAATAERRTKEAEYEAMSPFEKAAHDHPDLYDWLEKTDVKCSEGLGYVVAYENYMGVEVGPYFDGTGVHRSITEIDGYNFRKNSLRYNCDPMWATRIPSVSYSSKKGKLEYRQGDEFFPIVSSERVFDVLKVRPQCIVTVPDYMFTCGAILDVLAKVKKYYLKDGKVSDEELKAFATIVKGCKEKVKTIAEKLAEESKNYKQLAGKDAVAPQDKELEGLRQVVAEIEKM